MFVKYNANPIGKQVGDCTVRALSHALNQSWEETYIGLAIEGFIMRDMPSANSVWGAYLRKKGFQRHIIPNDLPVDYTVEDFCRDNPKGNFILALHGHLLSVINGDYYDSWESGNSYALGRGRNAKRDSMGRYSREGGYSEEGMSYEGNSYAQGVRGGNQGGNRGGNSRVSDRGGNSYARGRYSRDGAKDYMMEQLEEMMEQAENPKEREALKRCMMTIENA